MAYTKKKTKTDQVPRKFVDMYIALYRLEMQWIKNYLCISFQNYSDQITTTNCNEDSDNENNNRKDNNDKDNNNEDNNNEDNDK